MENVLQQKLTRKGMLTRDGRRHFFFESMSCWFGFVTHLLKYSYVKKCPIIPHVFRMMLCWLNIFLWLEWRTGLALKKNMKEDHTNACLCTCMEAFTHIPHASLWCQSGSLYLVARVRALKPSYLKNKQTQTMQLSLFVDYLFSETTRLQVFWWDAIGGICLCLIIILSHLMQNLKRSKVTSTPSVMGPHHMLAVV